MSGRHPHADTHCIAASYANTPASALCNAHSGRKSHRHATTRPDSDSHCDADTLCYTDADAGNSTSPYTPLPGGDSHAPGNRLPALPDRPTAGFCGECVCAFHLSANSSDSNGHSVAITDSHS